MGYVVVVRAWSAALFGMVLALSIAIVVWGMAAAYGFGPWSGSASASADWWMLFVALVIAAGYLVMTVADPESWGFVGPEGFLTLVHAIVVLGLWWLGTPGSPLSRWLPPGRDYYPIATALAALSAIHLGRRFTHPGSWHELAWVGDVRSELARRALSFQACFLALLAIALTGGIVSLTTVTTLFMAAAAMGSAAFMGGWAPAAGLASLAWAGAWSILGVVLARKLAFLAGDQQATWAAWGAMISAFALWQWAGVLRSDRPTSKGGMIAAEASTASLLRRFAVVVEGVASAAALLASAFVLAMGLQAGSSAAWVTFAGVGVLFAAAFLHILLAPRWRSEGPVYAAQALMVGAYVQFRLAYPLSTAADAAVLTLLAYLDMGIAEALERNDRAGHYTRPTRYTSLVLPLLPLLQLFSAPRLDDVSLFYLAAAATFYATACGRLRWKSLGYAAAVFADAALWLTWSRLGWRLAEHPQFYLVPVGLSAILFAEVNRELGRAAVNAIRTVGLIVIYVSLALPIWRFESFGAWLTLLLASLLGRLRRDRPAVADLPLAGAHDVRAGRRLRDGPRERRPRHGEVGDHAGPRDLAGALRRAQREEADPQPDARLLRPRPHLGMTGPRAIGRERLERMLRRPSRTWSDGAGCQETGTRIRSEIRDEWRARRGGIGFPGSHGAVDRGLTTPESSMSRMLVRRGMMIGSVVTLATIVTVLTGLAMSPARAAALGGRAIEPTQVVPLDQIAPERRDIVAEVIRDHTFHRQGDSDTFPCPANLYLSLLNEPHVTVALWKDLGDSPVQLQKVAANRYDGNDGSGSTATWEFVLRTPRLHVLLAYFNFVSPHGNARVDARIVLVVNTSYLRDNNKESFIQHNVDAYVKVDSRGWKTVARTMRPMVERILEEQVKEAGFFISLMSRLVLTYPNWASQVVSTHPGIDATTRQRFCTVVVQNRRAGASTGRPQVAQNQPNPLGESRRR